MIFKSIRKYTKVFIWIITIGILPSFIIWQIASSAGKDKKSIVGEIFGKKILYEEFMAAERAVREQAFLKYGENFERIMDIEEETWIRLMLLNKAKKMNIKVSEQEIFDEIKNLGVFRQYQNLDPRTYRAILLNALRTTPQKFENEIKKTVIMKKLVDSAISNIQVSDDELKKSYEEEYEKAKAAFILFSPESYVKNVTVTSEEISAYFNQHKQEFLTPLRRNVEFIEINFQNFTDNVTVTDEEIKKYYDNNPQEFSRKDKTEGSTESVKLPLEEVTGRIKDILTAQAMENLAQDKAKNILNEAITKDLSVAAKANALDVKQTGFFARNQEIPNIGLSYEFTKNAFSLKENEISPIIKTPKACYIIRVISEEKPRQMSEQEATSDINKMLMENKATELCRTEAENVHRQLKDIMVQTSKTFIDAAKELNLPLQTTEPFTRNGYIKILGPAYEFAEAAFKLKISELSPVVKTPRGYAILAPVEFFPVSADDYNKNKDLYKKRLLLTKQSQTLKNWFEGIKKEANFKNYLGLFKKLAVPPATSAGDEN